MKRSLLLFLTLIVLGCSSNGQNAPRSIEPCDCTIVFNDLIQKLESNYIALYQRVVSDSIYAKRKLDYAQKSASVETKDCTVLLNNFLSVFEDGHLSVFEYPNYTEEGAAEIREQVKQGKLSKDQLDQVIQSNTSAAGSSPDKLAGLWTDGKSDFIVVKELDTYRAYVTRSSVEGTEVGECKAIFTPGSKEYVIVYYPYNYHRRSIRGNVFKEGLMLRGINMFWIRKESWPRRDFELIDASDFKSPGITKLDEKNTLISLPSFELDYRAFNDFVKENKQLILNSENLIIDVRGNRGGNGVYFPLIELYATQNMEGSQGQVLASSDNLAYFERQMQYSSKIYKPLVQRIRDNIGTIVDGPLYPGKTFKISKNSKIKNVAILTDEGCASAAESFILHSKRSSSKVKTFGSPTEGMIDYTSVNSLLLNSGKQYIYFGYPTSTFHRDIPENGYNKTGIVPEVLIENNEGDKVDFIISHLDPVKHHK